MNPYQKIHKKASQKGSGLVIGDKVDLRICVEFARNSHEDKFFGDHSKVLRERKTITDQFYRRPGLKTRDKRGIAGYCMQIAGVEGQITNII